MEKVTAYKVCLADGKQVEGNEQCRNLLWSVDGNQFCIDALILPLYDYDMILGMQWLETLGRMTWDFGRRVLQFKHGGREIELQMTAKPKISWLL